MSSQEAITECMADIEVALMAVRTKQDEGLVRHHLDRIRCELEALVGIAVEPDTGPWSVSDDGRFLSSDDFKHDVMLEVKGDFWGDESRRAYSLQLALKLGGAKPRLKLPTFETDIANEWATPYYQLDNAEQKEVNRLLSNHTKGNWYEFKVEGGNGIGQAVYVRFGDTETWHDITNYSRW